MSSSVKKKYRSQAATLETVEQALRARIAVGAWAPGIMLPSRRDLAKEFEVDLHTLQRAIQPLLEDGTLQANSGRGTFVAPDPLAERKSFVSKPDTQGAVARPAEMMLRPVGTLGIIAVYDPSRTGAFDVAGVGTRDILRSLERTFSEAGGKTVFFNLFRTGGPWATVQEAGAALLAQGVHAIAIVGIQNDPQLGDLRLPNDAPATVPVIHISGAGSYQPLIHVFYDQCQTGYQAAEHLLQMGCRKLMFFVPFAPPWLEDRIEGARIALRDARLPADALRIFPDNHPLGPWSEEAEGASVDAIRQAFAGNLIEDGVIAPNDGIAHQFQTVAEEWDREPGRDFALIGFDDLPQSSFCGMTSIRPPFEEMGREAALLIRRRLLGENVRLNVCLRSHLIVRDSTARFAKQHALSGIS